MRYLQGMRMRRKVPLLDVHAANYLTAIKPNRFSRSRFLGAHPRQVQRLRGKRLVLKMWSADGEFEELTIRYANWTVSW